MSEKPECRLLGEDGNVFNVIALVSKALKNAGHPEKAKEWRERAMACESYDAVLQLTFEYVEPT